MAAVKAINPGCNGVMLDVSNQNFSDNTEKTKVVVDLAASRAFNYP